VVLQSLFEEQIDHESDELDRFIEQAAEIGAESTSHFPELGGRVMGPTLTWRTSRNASRR
jgi:dihydroorotate dehydrogenase (fumarate)